MPYRGRLIFPFMLEIAPLNLAGTAADPDAGGPLTTGYDQDFGEAEVLPTNDRLGRSARAESTAVRIPGQFLSTSAFLKSQQAANGNLASTEFSVLFHFADLEGAGLVETSTGTAKIKVGDRLVAVYTMAGDLVQKVRSVPGAFVISALPLFGLGGTRNLLEVTFKGRDPGGQGA